MTAQGYHFSISAKVSPKEAIKHINAISQWWEKKY